MHSFFRRPYAVYKRSQPFHPGTELPALTVGGFPAGSQLFGPDIAQITVQGAPISMGASQVFNPALGTITARGATGLLQTLASTTYGPGIAQAHALGAPALIGTTLVPPALAPTVAPFAPSLSELGLDAWERVGVSANQLTVTHLTSLRRSMNLVLTRWSNRGVSLWRVAKTAITLVAGQASYQLDGNVIEMLDSYVSVGDGGLSIDRLITPISRATYAALPSKSTAGPPTLYWFDRLVTPSITLWPVPDASTHYTLNSYFFTQVQDADLSQGNTANLPYRFLEAYTAAVAAHLALKWCDPPRAIALNGYAKECWAEASAEDREIVVSTIVPNFSAYLD